MNDMQSKARQGEKQTNHKHGNSEGHGRQWTAPELRRISAMSTESKTYLGLESDYTSLES